jgi:hypothetical protein
MDFRWDSLRPLADTALNAASDRIPIDAKMNRHTPNAFVMSAMLYRQSARGGRHR